MSKNQELEELFNTINTIYAKNINFLRLNHTKTYQKIIDFEKLKKENYFLDFENNHFELLDINKNKTYNCDPFFDAKQRVKDLKNKSCFNLLTNKFLEKKVFYKNQLSAYKFINEYLELERKENSYDKFIFLGTLLGVHINDFHKILKSKIYLILEDEIEIFRLSLFLTDYEDLEKNSKIFFCINQNIKEKENKIKDFLAYKKQYNNKIFFELSCEKSISNIEFLSSTFANNDPFNYPFCEYLVSLKRSFRYFNQKRKILKLQNSQDFFSKPILFLGAGPSLGENIEWVYMNQDSFILVCAAGALKRCELLDIVPDVILSIDGQNKQVLRQFDVKNKYYKDSLIISSTKTDEEVIKKIDSKKLFFMQDNVECFYNCGIFTGVTVGDIGLDLILRLGAKEIYMLGFDASVSKRGKTHDGTHTSRKVKNEKTNILKNQAIDSKNDLYEVKGNFRETVLTFMLYKQMIQSINKITKNTKAKIYNLSDGAKFLDIKALKTTELSIKKSSNINKEEVKKELENNLNSIVLESLSSKDKIDIKREQKILKKLKTSRINSFEENFKTLNTSYPNSSSIQIINQFFKLIKPYSFACEDKEIIKKQYDLIVKDLKEIYSYPFL